MDLSEEFEKAYTKVLKFLSYRPRSEKEIRDYLVRKKTDEKLIEPVITKLIEHKFLDDKEFTKQWAESRMRYKQKSKRVIAAELKQKGISYEMIEEVLAENLENNITDLELAKQIVEQKIIRYKNLPKEELFQKLAGQLGRRGFDWDTIKKVLKEYL